MPINLEELSSEEVLSAIYIGYFDRAADPEGLGFWTGVLTSQAFSLAMIATDFASQPEALNTFEFLSNPSPTSANSFISQVYLNLFNRLPDSAGLEFWSDVLQQRLIEKSGSDFGQLVLEIIGGAQDTANGNDLTTIKNKIEVAAYWTVAAEEAGVDYQNDPVIQASANLIIEDVTDDTNTVDAAKASLGPFIYVLPEQSAMSGTLPSAAYKSPMEWQVAPAFEIMGRGETVNLIGVTAAEFEF